MDDGFFNFLEKLQRIAQDRAIWLGGTMRLQIGVYLTTELPPLTCVTSIRAVLLSSAGCAVLHNADGTHVLPGGRIEADESIEEALRREIMEETGCSVRCAQLIGLLHFHHQTPKPQNYAYPYPDFAHLVFAARAGEIVNLGGDPDGYEQRVEFVSPADLDGLTIPEYQRLLVGKALELFGR